MRDRSIVLSWSRKRTPVYPWLALLALILFALGGRPAVLGAGEDSCVDCHSDPTFLVKNKKLHDYYENWKLSIHAQEGITCSDCHGGNPKVKDKEGSHAGKSMGATAKASPVNYANIPATCAQCHKDIYDSYRKSKHFKHVVAKGEDKQGPNCVTCHLSVNTQVLNVKTVRKTCEICHNEESKNKPDIPGRAESLLNKFLSIHRFYRYFTKRSDVDMERKTFQTIENQTEALFIEWHTFDIDQIEERTRILLDYLKQKRSESRTEQTTR